MVQSSRIKLSLHAAYGLYEGREVYTVGHMQELRVDMRIILKRVFKSSKCEDMGWIKQTDDTVQ
jgi:hypothetical protein